MKNGKTYSELITLKTFEDRFEYLKLNGRVGESTFGSKRYLNQILYKTDKWLSVRDRVIATKLSNEAVHLLSQGIGNRVVGYKAGQVVNYDIFEALKMEKPFPLDTLKVAYETSN